MATSPKTLASLTPDQSALLASKVAHFERAACTCSQIGTARGCLTCQFWNIRIGLADLATQLRVEIGASSGLEVNHG